MGDIVSTSAMVLSRLKDAGYRPTDSGLINIPQCPFWHDLPEGKRYCLEVGWEVPDEDGFLFFVECGCGARGTLRDDPIAAVKSWCRRTVPNMPRAKYTGPGLQNT